MFEPTLFKCTKADRFATDFCYHDHIFYKHSVAEKHEIFFGGVQLRQIGEIVLAHDAEQACDLRNIGRGRMSYREGHPAIYERRYSWIRTSSITRPTALDPLLPRFRLLRHSLRHVHT